MLEKDLNEYDQVFAKELGEKLKFLRKKMGCSTETFAALIKVPYARLYTYEVGTRTCPMSVLKKACVTAGENFIRILEEIDKVADKKAKIKAAIKEESPEEIGSLGEN